MSHPYSPNDMKEEFHVRIDSIGHYTDFIGIESHHPLVAVVDMSRSKRKQMAGTFTYHYDLYALWLKQTNCGDMTYGRMPYDYQEGTITSFAPGQVVKINTPDDYQPKAIGLLFHPDLIRGHELGRDIKKYNFFSYSSREALHMSEEERNTFKLCLKMIDEETRHPYDAHSKKILCDNIRLLLEHCMRFYERQFDTRQEVNRDVLERFEDLMDTYFDSTRPIQEGLPTVKYFAEACFLSPNYFGDLVKKETGRSPQEHIQAKMIDLAKEQLLSTEQSISEIAYRLGFRYSQHFNRFFKRNVGVAPSDYRRTAV